MKKFALLSALVASLGFTQIASADTLALWTFESLTVSGTAATTPSPNNFAPEVGSGSASALHASASTVWSTPAGNISAKSLSANNWAVGDYFQFTTSTLGYTGVTISYDQTGSGTGPRDFAFSYSTDGVAFTPFGSTYGILINGTPNPSWGAATGGAVYNIAFNLTAVTALDNVAAVWFRVVDASTTSINGGTVATTGTSRIDNFTISATPVPEPTAAAIVGGFGLLGLLMVSRRRN